jgi:hypothetical protein
MRRSFLGSLVAAGLSWFAPVLPAQCIQLAGSGCPTGVTYQCGGQPRIGQTFTVTCPGCRVGQTGFLVAGGCLPTPWPAFFPPATCQIGPCRLAADPWISYVPGFAQFPIPRNSALVGARFCVQCGCLDRARPCFDLGLATEVRIQA